MGRCRTMELENEIILRKVENQLAEQRGQYDRMANDYARRISDLEEQLRRFEGEDGEKGRKEMRKYVESLNEKEAELGGLRRQVASLKNKISGLENELAGVVGVKDDL